MTAISDAACVVQSYDKRARFARAEGVAVRRPRVLRGLLDSVMHVAEVPCGAGHFLADYARAGAAVVLADASAAMLDVAVEHATEVGLRADRTSPVLAYVQTLYLPPEVELVVSPNAALNQLACQSPLTDLLAALRRAMRPGAQVLAQIACTHPGGGVDSSTFYDPARRHGVWFADRRFDPHFVPHQDGGAVLRRRRQHRDNDRLRIDFDYLDATATSLHTTTVEMRLFSASTLSETLTATGFVHIRFLPGHGGLSEVLATAETNGAWR